MRIFYGWIVAGAILTAWGISVGPRQSFSIFLLPLMEEFGSSRSAAAAAFSVHMACYALGGWALGILVDRWGPKRVIAWCTGCWALVLFLSSRAHSLWQFYLVYGLLGGVTTSGVSYVPNNSLLSRWFVRYRGFAIGIAQAGIPLGAAVFGPLAQLGITAVGWRSTNALFGLVVAGTALPLVLGILRDTPEEMGLTPDGIPVVTPDSAGHATRRPPPEGAPSSGLPRGYWPIFGANILRGMAMYALLVHEVAYLVDAGFSRMAAASYFSASALLAVPGGLAAGAISDRLGRLKTYAGVAGLYVVAYGALLLVRAPSQVATLLLFVVAAGLALGGATPVYAALLTDRLQGPRLGFLLGLQNIGFGLGATVGPLLGGVIFDLLGSYTLAFLLMAACMALSSLILSTTTHRAAPVSVA